jgi:DNA-binding FrmR family transcriptional regulator
MTNNHTHHGYYQNKDQTIKRLKRAEGQVRGIARMIDEDKYCIDILTQVSAAQAALDKVALELLRDHAHHCMVNISNENEQKDKANELVGAIQRMVSR